MHYGSIKKCDIANGEGIRVSLFVSGCRNRCKGCFQPETWDFTYGKLFDNTAAEEIFSAVDNPSVRGLTILGGEPMEPENQRELLLLLREFKVRFPEKTVWLYTGNLYEEQIGEIAGHRTHTEHTAELLSLVDVLVDGAYVEEEKSLGLRFRGSKNQRIIDMNLTRHHKKVMIWEGCKLDRSF
ncbi:MAG: anaerobic ribonucleoside-triphosphate reductase activating protein [Clostridia bacterium]|nr:anaerobic ribonucleoside-triphosphate reductase activating protein [Clostridia bacterium]